MLLSQAFDGGGLKSGITPIRMRPLLWPRRSTATRTSGGSPAFELAASTQPRLWLTNPGVVDLDRTMQRLAGDINHGSAQFVEDQPCRFIAGESKLALQAQRRNAARVSRHQIPRPEPLGRR